MFANFEMTLSGQEVLKRTYAKTMRDHALDLASQLAYYFFLALFPALLCMLAVASFFPLQNFTGEVIRTLGPFAPREVLEIIRQEMAKIGDGHNGGLLTIGLLGALWSSSAALVSVIDVMNRAYDITEARPWWKVRAVAIGLTTALAVFITLAFVLIVVGPQIADWLGAHLGFSTAFVWSWKILQWPLAFAMVAIGVGLVYYFAPDAEQEWVWVTPGSLAATVLWFIASLAFRFYAVNFGNYEATYGAIGGVILLMLWFYMSALVMIVGAEMNAEIEHASPWGKEPGEKVPGQKKKIGLAAATAWRQRGGVVSTLRPALPPAVAPEPAALPAWLETALSYVTLLLRWRNRTKA